MTVQEIDASPELQEWAKRMTLFFFPRFFSRNDTAQQSDTLGKLEG
jgi:hypothetical protein